MTVTMTPEQETARKAAKAQKERDRRARIKEERIRAEAAASNHRPPKDPEAQRVADDAKRAAPGIKSTYHAFEVRSLMDMVGDGDPIAYAQIPEDALGRRSAERVLRQFARGELPTDDPAGRHLRLRTREISRDERGRNLWGRKIAAILVAMAGAR